VGVTAAPGVNKGRFTAAGFAAHFVAAWAGASAPTGSLGFSTFGVDQVAEESEPVMRIERLTQHRSTLRLNEVVILAPM
jgi:hypothetical protein